MKRRISPPLSNMRRSAHPRLNWSRGRSSAASPTLRCLPLQIKSFEAVKSGAIRKFVVMAGCDGRAKSRNYYTDFAKALPKDTVILTAGCAKYKYNKLDLGDIGGIPRVLDAGQCNDSYSLAVIALKLKEVFGLDDINDLPIVYNIAWYEQKAVIVLLGAALPRCEEHSSRSHTPRIPLTERGEDPCGKLRDRRNRHGRG